METKQVSVCLRGDAPETPVCVCARVLAVFSVCFLTLCFCFHQVILIKEVNAFAPYKYERVRARIHVERSCVLQVRQKSTVLGVVFIYFFFYSLL